MWETRWTSWLPCPVGIRGRHFGWVDAREVACKAIPHRSGDIWNLEAPSPLPNLAPRPGRKRGAHATLLDCLQGSQTQRVQDPGSGFWTPYLAKRHEIPCMQLMRLSSSTLGLASTATWLRSFLVCGYVGFPSCCYDPTERPNHPLEGDRSSWIRVCVRRGHQARHTHTYGDANGGRGSMGGCFPPWVVPLGMGRMDLTEIALDLSSKPAFPIHGECPEHLTAGRLGKVLVHLSVSRHRAYA